jgi:polyisoprenoid-binding protein YceI
MATSEPAAAELSALVGRWVLDPERTTIEFHTKAMWVFPAKGTARALEGEGSVGPDGSFSGTLVVDAASINTKNKKRDEHLRTADFFEVAKHPTITYTAKGGRLTPSGKVEVDGDLTVHGQTKALPLVAEVEVAGDSATVSTQVDVDRSDWGLTLTPYGAGLKNRVVVHAYFHKVDQ